MAFEHPSVALVRHHEIPLGSASDASWHDENVSKHKPTRLDPLDLGEGLGHPAVLEISGNSLIARECPPSYSCRLVRRKLLSNGKSTAHCPKGKEKTRESPILHHVPPIGSTGNEENSSGRGYWGRLHQRQHRNSIISLIHAFYPSGEETGAWLGFRQILTFAQRIIFVYEASGESPGKMSVTSLETVAVRAMFSNGSQYRTTIDLMAETKVNIKSSRSNIKALGKGIHYYRDAAYSRTTASSYGRTPQYVSARSWLWSISHAPI
ncbi:hypothetical protein N7457_006931 [Penicillium paradoxum]|uniref:uncharacterized protein n=1 Tax=Penicillium paradoxum TaxID=176176 RepID=UPI0025484DE5|nr:uncharacterized protein N7457_006931 [Penicillium paradoxum]KAJ5779211.1 hypothetical protein N7457_006931 [Penicillium paradoxum]